MLSWTLFAHGSNPTSYHLILKKTFYMIFHWARLKSIDGMNDDVIMDDNALIKVNSIKYIGVIVDNKLN